MIINKFLSPEQIKKVGEFYNMDINELSKSFNDRELQIFESKQHLITWLAVSDEDRANRLLNLLLDMKIGELRKEGVNNALDAYFNIEPNICVAGSNRYIYLQD